jgi:hypothetical protein
MGLGIYRAIAARVSGRQMDGKRTLASVPRPHGGHPAATGVLGAGRGMPPLHGAPASRWGRPTGERGKVGMRLTAGPTWR